MYFSIKEFLKTLVVDRYNSFILFIYFYVVLRIKPSASHVLGKCSTSEPQSQPYKCIFIYILYSVNVPSAYGVWFLPVVIVKRSMASRGVYHDLLTFFRILNFLIINDYRQPSLQDLETTNRMTHNGNIKIIISLQSVQFLEDTSEIISHLCQ